MREGLPWATNTSNTTTIVCTATCTTKDTINKVYLSSPDSTCSVLLGAVLLALLAGFSAVETLFPLRTPKSECLFHGTLTTSPTAWWAWRLASCAWSSLAESTSHVQDFMCKISISAHHKSSGILKPFLGGWGSQKEYCWAIWWASHPMLQW